MTTKTDKGGATSTAIANEEATQGAPEGAKDASGLMKAVDASVPEVAAEDTQVGKFDIGSLSQAALDDMNKELREALAQISNGFGELAAPRDLFPLDQPFYVIDGFSIFDYEDKRKGEILTKHIFRLEYPDGVVKNVMQSDARPRRVLAKAFMLATGLGGRLRIGPYKFKKKPIAGQPEAAYIFEQQPGFTQQAY